MWTANTTQPTDTWDDLVLPESQVNLLKLIFSQFRLSNQQNNRQKTLPAKKGGQGMAVLFIGPPGTGKHLAARILANVLETHLWRFDLNLLVSKFSGETENNLHQLLNQADELRVILLMDNAEALFGKRAEVKDSHDRYAKFDTHYMLLRLDQFKGVAIFSVKQKNMLEPTLLQKMRFTVEFPFPDREAREKIWKLSLANPSKKLNFKWLARFELSGSSINTIARDVSSRTAREGRPVTINMSRVVEGIRKEYLRLGQPINETDFKIDDKPVYARTKPSR